jgi:formylglycine-generating enzyme required for sulfatase activity
MHDGTLIALAAPALLACCAAAAQARTPAEDLNCAPVSDGQDICVVVETVAVGNPGNAGDPQLDGTFGSVAYEYRMGTHEVTADQYTRFLNAVAPTDTYALYNPSMWTHDHGCMIERTGAPGSYEYAVAQDRASRPVNFVSFGDAMRFANWLHNGQPAGSQDLTTTEDGSYFLDGRMSDDELEDVFREPDADWVVPSEDEWYKAAYHANDGVTGNYFTYPMGVDFGISNDLTDPDPGGHATYSNHPNDFTIGAPYYRTEVGAHENSASPYGTFDQGGNVVEWNESIPLFNGRGLRGGAYIGSSDQLAVWTRPIEYHSSDEFSDIGFRLALVGESFEDGDGDGVADAADNCTGTANAEQRDTDADGIGNACDADLNQSCIVNFGDLALMKSVFFSADPDADLNGDGTVNFLDLGIMTAGFFEPPGPSGVPNLCDGP